VEGGVFFQGDPDLAAEQGSRLKSFVEDIPDRDAGLDIVFTRSEDVPRVHRTLKYVLRIDAGREGFVTGDAREQKGNVQGARHERTENEKWAKRI
jgi:hypothetical protein